jgi:hypothetical protein
LTQAGKAKDGVGVADGRGVADGQGVSDGRGVNEGRGVGDGPRVEVVVGVVVAVAVGGASVATWVGAAVAVAVGATLVAVAVQRAVLTGASETEVAAVGVMSAGVQANNKLPNRQRKKNRTNIVLSLTISVKRMKRRNMAITLLGCWLIPEFG